MRGLTTCCKVLIIWIHSDCFCKQMLQILFLIKYQGLDSNVGPCQQKIAQLLALGPNPTKGWLWMPETLQASLSCGQAIQTSSYDAKSLDFGVFLGCQGGSAVQMAAWQQTCVQIEHDALQSGWRELLPHNVNNHHYKFLESFEEDTGVKVGQESKEKLWPELSFKQYLFFSYHLVGFFSA